MESKKRVLIVEDDPGTVDLLHQIVTRSGYEPIPAYGGWEALRLLQERGADLVLLDLMLRDMDGWTLLEKAKADDQYSSVPVIIISAKRPLEHLQQVEAHAGKFEVYLTKPFEVDELVSKMAQLLA